MSNWPKVGDRPFIVLVRVKVKGASLPAYHKFAQESVEKAKAEEPGMLHRSFDIDTRDPTRFVWTEVFKKESDLVEAHFKAKPYSTSMLEAGPTGFTMEIYGTISDEGKQTITRAGVSALFFDSKLGYTFLKALKESNSLSIGASGSEKPFVIIARIKIKQGMVDAYMPLAEKANDEIEASETGMLHHTWDADPRDPTSFTWSEVYKNEGALMLSHMKNPPVGEYIGAHVPMVEGAPPGMSLEIYGTLTDASKNALNAAGLPCTFFDSKFAMSRIAMLDVPLAAALSPVGADTPFVLLAKVKVRAGMGAHFVQAINSAVGRTEAAETNLLLSTLDADATDPNRYVWSEYYRNDDALMQRLMRSPAFSEFTQSMADEFSVEIYGTLGEAAKNSVRSVIPGAIFFETKLGYSRIGNYSDEFCLRHGADFSAECPFILIARLDVKADKLDEYIKLCALANDNIEQSEPDMIHHNLDADPRDPTKFTWTEVYKNEAALMKKHMGNPPVGAYIGEHVPLVNGAPPGMELEVYGTLSEASKKGLGGALPTKFFDCKTGFSRSLSDFTF